ncbi:MAG: GTPase Era [Pseudomonadota bacterium]
MNNPCSGSNALRCGFIALVGAPNAGKSTLINQLVGQKVAIVSPKVQTTRTRVLGILLEGQSQLVFVDTPGIFAPKRRLDRSMVSAAWEGADEADVIAVLIDATRRSFGPDVELILDRLRRDERKAILLLNKVDAVQREKLLRQTQELNATDLFDKIFMISALTGDGVEDFVHHLAGIVPEGPWLFPEDQVSDMPMRLLAAEITREKLFQRLHQELPYAIAVETEEWQTRKDGSVQISQVVYVERDGQKGIVLGAGGRTIKAIGTEARLELADILECKVHLNLFVKVRRNWTENPERFRDLGLNYNS